MVEFVEEKFFLPGRRKRGLFDLQDSRQVCYNKGA
jgi:hypothetical protein